MGYSDRRYLTSGAVRFYAYARDLAGKRHYVGSYPSEIEANVAWGKREIAYGRGEVVDDDARRRTTFTRYVEDVFLPTYRPSLKRQRDMKYALYAESNGYIAFFGNMPIAAVSRTVVRAFLTALIDNGATPSTVRSHRANLAVIFNRAADDGYRDGSPTTRLKMSIRETPVRIRPPSPDDYAAIHDALPGPFTRMLVEMLVSTGMRIGEATELRVQDVDELGERGFVRVERAVSDVGAELGNGSRFVVNDMTKGGEDRRIVLQDPVFDRLLAHIERLDIAEGDLLFSYAPLMAELAAAKPEREGQRRPAARQRTNTTGHIPDDLFRKSVWQPTLAKIGMAGRWVPHELRHAYGTWALAAGANIVDVQADYGHKHLTTTQRYVHAAAGLRTGASDAAAAMRATRVTDMAERRRRRTA